MKPLRTEQEEEPAVLQKIWWLPFLSFLGTMAQSWCLISLASSQGQQEFLKLSPISATQCWKAPSLTAEHLKSPTECRPKVLEFKKVCYVKWFNLLFLKLIVLIKVSLLRLVPVNLLWRAGQVSLCTMYFSTSVLLVMNLPVPGTSPCHARNPLPIRLFQAEQINGSFHDPRELSVCTFTVTFYWPAFHFGLWAPLGKEQLFITLVPPGPTNVLKIRGYSGNICWVNEWVNFSFVCTCNQSLLHTCNQSLLPVSTHQNDSTQFRTSTHFKMALNQGPLCISYHFPFWKGPFIIILLSCPVPTLYTGSLGVERIVLIPELYTMRTHLLTWD